MKAPTPAPRSVSTDVGRLLFQLAVEEGLPLRGISRRFHSLGLRSPSGETIWQATTIRNWLCNPAAKGVLYQLRYESVARPGSVVKGRKERPREEWYELAVPPLVSDDVWEAAQQQLRRNKELAARNTHREYLLRGLVKCTGCGRRMTGYSHARYSYYRCPVQAQKKYSTASKCVTPSVRADRLEPAVWEAVTELLKNPERLREEILQRRGKDSPPRTLIEEQLVLRRKRFSEIPAEQDRLVDGYGKGLIPDHRMKSRMGALEREYEEAVAGIAELEHRKSRPQLSEREEANAFRFAKRMAEGLANLTFSERQQVLRLLVEDVTLRDDHAVVRIIIPTEGTEEGSALCTPVRGRVGGYKLTVEY